MKKHVFGRKLKRDKNQRTALFKGLISSFILHGKMKTTEAKAKAVKGTIDSLVTKVKKNSQVVAKRLIGRYVAHNAISKFVDEVAPALSLRPGAYTTMIKLGRRLKDDSPMVLLRWAEEIPNLKTPSNSAGRQNSKLKGEAEAKVKGVKELPFGEEKVKKVSKPKVKKEKAVK